MEEKLSSSSLGDMIRFDENKNFPDLNTTITFETSASKLHTDEETFSSCSNEVFNDSFLNKTMTLTSSSLLLPSSTATEILPRPNEKLPNVSIQSDKNQDNKLIHENKNNFGNGSQSKLEINAGILEFSPQFIQKDLGQNKEEFHDAVQFFNDSTSFEFLKNAGNSGVPEKSANTRLSLFRNFDPLHALQNEEQILHLSTLNEVENDPASDNKSFTTEESKQDTKEIINKHISKVSDDSSNILISFDSPVKKNVPSIDPNTPSNILISFDSPKSNHIGQDLLESNIIVQEDSKEINKKILLDTSSLNIEKSGEKVITKNRQVIHESSPLVSLETSIKRENLSESNNLSEPKFYTEEEFQDALRIQKLDYENKLLKLEEENKNLSKQSKTWRIVLTEFCQIFDINEDKRKKLESTIEELKQDLKQAAEDHQNVEKAFANLLQRYEVSKSMVKSFNENENTLKEELENKKAKLLEVEKLFEVLKARAQSELDKAAEEMVTFKKSSEAQIAVLQAQLRKAELKITSLESDIIQVKKENSQLGGICDDLISKVGKS